LKKKGQRIRFHK